ncbi:MAG: hypothetical protein IMZ67_06465, partial [Acidobacteria bacterium]|nr:hypothetical protein [Acidobacteriota bacterium]
MYKRTISDEDMSRLRAEREAADAAYNDALTAADQAMPRALTPPAAGPPPDDSRLAALEGLWTIVPTAPPAGGRGVRGRLSGFVWRLVGPILQRQQEFNAALVDHAGRQLASAREARQAVEASLSALHHDLGAAVAFQAQLIRYLQQITLFVDTKDRQLSGEIRQIT